MIASCDNFFDYTYIHVCTGPDLKNDLLQSVAKVVPEITQFGYLNDEELEEPVLMDEQLFLFMSALLHNQVEWLQLPCCDDEVTHETATLYYNLLLAMQTEGSGLKLLQSQAFSLLDMLPIINFWTSFRGLEAYFSRRCPD